MTMKNLIISDLHLTDSPTEAYRWNVFKLAQENIIKYQCEQLLILGDVFDKKDRHPSSIVNQLTTVLAEITKQVPIIILKGNHDYINPDDPFLQFLKHLPKVTWINEPTIHPINGKTVAWLPHTKTPIETWEPFLAKYKLDFLFMHQSVIGSKTSSDFEINNALDLSWLEERAKCPIISGDIHVPQTIRTLTYVGTQHPVAFGDDYNYRMLLIDFGMEIKVESIPIESMKRHSITIMDMSEFRRLHDKGVLKTGDQIKVKITLDETNLGEWNALKNQAVAWCESHGIHVADVKLEKLQFGNTLKTTQVQDTYAPVHPQAAFDRYIENGLDLKIVNVGKLILNEVLNENGTFNS